MKDHIKSIIAASISIGLADRATFVSQMSEVINRYQSDPESADKWAEKLAVYLEQTRNNINLENAIRNGFGANDMPDKADIHALTTALTELTDHLKKSQKQSNQ